MMNGIDHTLGMGWIWIIGLILLVIVIWIIIRTLGQKSSRNQSDNKTPLDILKERYARGEISKQEFEEKKKGIS
ncbi:MAG: SHOCT domain-containing protein [Bacteroidales bacterium]|nr:SHOCT domain-containing protein [Bacteroidales bacterium]